MTLASETSALFLESSAPVLGWDRGGEFISFKVDYAPGRRNSGL
jgi:hypothetical protein